MAFCSKCGSELRSGAKFCSKCGVSVYSAEENCDKKKKSKLGYIALAILALLIIGIGLYSSKDAPSGSSGNQVGSVYNLVDSDSIETPVDESVVSSSSQSPQAEEQNNLESQREKEFQEKMMGYTGQIQNIMTQINSVYNRFASASSSLDDTRRQMVGVNAASDISDLCEEGDMIFRKMMNLAREYGRQDMVSTIKQEMDDFDRQAYTMSSNINRYIYN